MPISTDRKPTTGDSDSRFEQAYREAMYSGADFIIGPLQKEYVARLAHLSQGSALERAGAWLMGADPASLWVASLLQPLFG